MANRGPERLIGLLRHLADRAIGYGTERCVADERSRIRTSNVLALIGLVVTSVYSVVYLFLFESPLAFVFNLTFALAYGLNFAILRLGRPIEARASIFVVFMLDVFATSTLFFSVDLEMHLFLIAVGPVAFFLFERDQRTWRYALTMTSAALYLLVELVPPQRLLGEPPETLSRWLAMFTVPVVIAVLILVERAFLDEIANRERALDHAARTDPLTGIPNRIAAFEQAQDLLIRARRDHTSFEVLMIDIDHFKRVNDDHGHLVGDAVLRTVADTLRSALRPDDVVGRFGGEEFLVAVNHSSSETPGIVAERLRRRVEALDLCPAEGIDLRCTVSIGVARLDERCPSFDCLLERADTALYAAKAAGRNRSMIAASSGTPAAATV